MSNKKPRAAKKVPIDYKNGKIYKVVNDLNDNEYIGSTTQTLSRRFSSHKVQKRDSKFYKAMQTIGTDHFKILLIEHFPCGSKAELEAREYAVMKTFDATKLYNSIHDGKHSEETKKQIAATLGVGPENKSFKRGSISEYIDGNTRGWRFTWRDGGKHLGRRFSYGHNRTSQEAYMQAMAAQESVYPRTTLDLLRELPFFSAE